MVTVLVPRPTRVPMVGIWLMVTTLQLSEATTALVKLGTMAWQLALADAEMLVAHWVIVGVVVSLMVTTLLHVESQPVTPSVIVDISVKLPEAPALTVTEALDVEPTMVPLPVTDQLYVGALAAPA